MATPTLTSTPEKQSIERARQTMQDFNTFTTQRNKGMGKSVIGRIRNNQMGAWTNKNEGSGYKNRELFTPSMSSEKGERRYT